ncbi:MAG: response regulator [Lachnospiraceae bacterium]|nr:response regulator [Lachnospiraceae bacterium]
MYKLLIVDDEYVPAEALKKLLEVRCKGLQEIRTVGDGNVAVKTAAWFRPDIVIMDIRLPGIDGIEASRQIKKLLPECRIVLLTAFGEFAYAKAAISIGVQEFIEKPAEDEHIVGVINKLTDELDNHELKKRMEDNSDQAMQLLEHMMIQSIICNNVGEKEADDFFRTIGSEPKCMVAVVADTKYEEGERTDYLPSMLENSIDGIKGVLSHKGYESYATSIGGKIYVFALCDGSGKTERVIVSAEDLEKELRQIIARTLYHEFTVGVVKFHDKEKMYEAFLQASRRCNTDLSKSGNGDEKKQKGNDVYPTVKEEELIRNILSGKKEASFEIIDMLFDWMREQHASVDMIRYKAHELLVLILHRAEKDYSLSGDSGEDKTRMLRMFNSELEIRNYLKRTVGELIDEIGKKETNRVESLVRQVCEHIESNYQRMLTLDDVAEKVNLNKFYLSKSFKKVTGMNFTDYVTEIRMEHAKELLKDPSINVKDIGFFVGYDDSYYFSKVFKSKFGMTPTAYRKKQ